MTFRQASREIEKLGWWIIAATGFTDGVRYEATNGKFLAKGEKCYTPDEALASTYRAVLRKVAP